MLWYLRIYTDNSLLSIYLCFWLEIRTYLTHENLFLLLIFEQKQDSLGKCQRKMYRHNGGRDFLQNWAQIAVVAFNYSSFFEVIFKLIWKSTSAVVDLSILFFLGNWLRILNNIEKDVSYPDIQFWNRASDPILARDPFSSLMWVVFCLPYPFLSCEDSLLHLIHVFFAVNVIQVRALIAIVDIDDCLSLAS